MRVRLLGPVSVEAGGAAVGLGGLKQRAVFALLALGAGRVVPLDRLVDELWRDEPPARATLTLQSYVSRLRRILAELPGAAPEIVTRPPGWVLTLDPDQVDVTRFEALVADADARLHEGDADAAAGLLGTALDLWTGDFMADLEALSFARREAVRLNGLRLSATELLLEARLARGESDAVADQARAFVTAHPFRERAWSALMLACYRSGRQSEALAAAAELRRILADELGLDPVPETRRLEERILRQDPALSALPPVQRPVPAGVAPAEPQVLLAGRGDVLARLDAVVAEAAGGRGRLLVFEAPAGFGKSTMMQALAGRARDAGATVLRGGGVGSGAVPALWPWVTMMRELGEDLPEPDAAVERADGKAVLYRRVVDLLGEARRTRPLAVLLDDAHWVDAETITLLSLTVDQLAARGVLFAVAIRPEEPGPAKALDRTRRDLIMRIPLPGLDEPGSPDWTRTPSSTAASRRCWPACWSRRPNRPAPSPSATTWFGRPWRSRSPRPGGSGCTPGSPTPWRPAVCTRRGRSTRWPAI